MPYPFDLHNIKPFQITFLGNSGYYIAYSDRYFLNWKQFSVYRYL